MSYIPSSSLVRTSFTPSRFFSGEPDKLVKAEGAPTFTIQHPTSLEKDTLGARLIELGLQRVTKVTLRAVLIDDLFNHFPVEKAEEHANFLDVYWQQEQANNLARAKWQEQEEQRLIDVALGAQDLPQASLPNRIGSIRDEARAALLVEEMQAKSARLRKMLARQVDFDRQHALMLVRLHVVSVTGLDVAVERDDNALTAATADALRDAMTEQDWNELTAHVDSLYEIGAQEVKNSGSLPEKPSPLNGSEEQSGGSESSAGSSTKSSIEPALIAGSETTTGSSSPSTSEHESSSSTSSQMAEA